MGGMAEHHGSRVLQRQDHALGVEWDCMRYLRDRTGLDFELWLGLRLGHRRRRHSEDHDAQHAAALLRHARELAATVNH